MLDVAPISRSHQDSMLRYLEALTFDFHREGRDVSAVLIYAEPDPATPGRYVPHVAADSGFEGVACVDDTARAALLALADFEATGSRSAMALARKWLTFVEYMQYPDGSFANFIRSPAGVRNCTGPTSIRGGYWWSARALWALGRAYRLTGEASYRDSYLACRLAPLDDGKINAVLALAEMELIATGEFDHLRDSVEERCRRIATMGARYFLDHPASKTVHLWGYHQLHAVATAAVLLARDDFADACVRTVRSLVEPDVEARFWYSFPSKRKDGVCAYCVTPIVQGLAALYRATRSGRYRDLALDATDWFYGRNDAHVPMYDATTGMCRDGIQRGRASDNCGAESAIEAGLAELERRFLLRLA